MNKLIKTTQITLMAALMATSTIAQDAPADLNLVVASVNGTEIYLGDVLALHSELPEEYTQQDPSILMPQLIDQLVSQELLGNEVDEENEILRFKKRQAERAAELNVVLDAHVAENLTDEYLKKTYDDAVGNVEAEIEYSAAHILLETEEAALDVKSKLDGGADFVELAKEASTGPSAPNGGDLGWFGKGQMVPEFETAVATLEKGAVSEPIQTQFGWHVIKLNDMREIPKPTFEEVLPQLTEYATQLLMDEKIKAVSAEADIEMIEGIDPALLNTTF